MNGRRGPRDQWKALVASQKPATDENGKTTDDETADEPEHRGSAVNRAFATLRRYRRIWLGGCLFILVICLVAVYSGNGRPDRFPVSGQVLIDGEPLAHGEVRFIPDGARASIGTLDEHGRFTLTCFDGSDGAVPGTHRVEVATAESLNEKEVRWHAPEKYASFETSGLSVEITGPTDDLVIKLTWDGEQPIVERG